MNGGPAGKPDDMRALTVIPGRPDSAGVSDCPEPEVGDGEVLVRSVLVGLCGTDSETMEDGDGDEPLVIGHESLAEVVEAPQGSGFQAGERVIGVVRRPCPPVCVECSAGRLDRCRNDEVNERGISRLDGFGSELWTSSPDYLVPVPESLGDNGVLVEPATAVVKGLRRMDAAVEAADDRLERVLVVGPGSIGLLAALLLARRGLDVTVGGSRDNDLKRELVTELGATYVVGEDGWKGGDFDAVVECSGAAPVIQAAVPSTRKSGYVVLLGVYAGDDGLSGDGLGAVVMRDLTVVGSVNASRPDHERAAEQLAAAPQDWLDRLITDRGGPDDWPRLLDEADIKGVVRFG
jgi:glucose 1-dehydrogenase